MYKLDISKKAFDFIKNLQAKQFKQVQIAILELLKNPTPHDSKALVNYPNLFRKDIGEYRVVYRYDTEVVYIMLVDKRNDDEIYKQLKRLS
ncbi:plasmid stabilization system [Thioploca ingrica]|uniref:Plasmid stabilization system n=1 Tax=Thioploca ingrica TaxID=40754 RepID=A0A090ANU2_9GAMM|nr:plasmid stabilization system [Thioploca ingrica]